MGSSRFWLKAADEESKSNPHEFPRSHWLKATGQCVLERYLSATMTFTMLRILRGYEILKPGTFDREPSFFFQYTFQSATVIRGTSILKAIYLYLPLLLNLQGGHKKVSGIPSAKGGFIDR